MEKGIKALRGKNHCDFITGQRRVAKEAFFAGSITTLAFEGACWGISWCLEKAFGKKPKKQQVEDFEEVK